MKTYYISDGTEYKSPRMWRRKLSTKDARYLTWSTSYKDISWTYFSSIEDDFRLLHKPLSGV